MQLYPARMSTFFSGSTRFLSMHPTSRPQHFLSRMGAGGANGGDSQRQLAQEAEQAARQLERLAREQQSQALSDAARRLPG